MDESRKDIYSIDKTILANFYKLNHKERHVRLTAASSTCKILKAIHKNQKSFNENLNYCIERLVAGLASSKQSARLGYSTLLLEVLETYSVSTERLLTLANKKFGNINQDTVMNNLVGYFLLFAIILKSKNITKTKANNQHVEKIFKQLYHLWRTKSYFENPVALLIFENKELFHSSMLSSIQEVSTSHDLLIVLLCHKIEPLREIENLDLTRHAKLLIDDKFVKQPIHPLLIEMNAYMAAEKPKFFTEFYTNSVIPFFFKPNHNDRACIGFELTLKLLLETRIQDIKTIKTILNGQVLKVLIVSLRNRKALSEECLSFFKSLKEYFTTNESRKKQLAILAALISTPSSITFDYDSRTSCFESLLLVSSKETLISYLKKLISTIEDDSRTKLVPHCAKQLAVIASRPQLHEELETITKIIKFLLLHTFFVTRNFDDAIISQLKKAFDKSLFQAISIAKSQDRIKLLQDLADFIDDNFSSRTYAYRASESDKLEISKIWKLYKQRLDSHMKLVGDKKTPVTFMYLMYGLQIVEYQLDCEIQLDELDVFARNEAQADSLIEQLMALLSARESCVWTRKSVEIFMNTLLENLSHEVLKEILNTSKNSLEDSDGEISVEDDEVSGEDNDTHIKNLEKEQDESMEVDEIDNRFEFSSVPNDGDGCDDEEEEEEYLDDEAMLRLDQSIANMVTLRRKKLLSKQPANILSNKMLRRIRKALTERGQK